MIFENGNKLKGYLSNESKKSNIHSNNIYTMYFIRQFLDKVYHHDKKNLIIKRSVFQLANTMVV